MVLLPPLLKPTSMFDILVIHFLTSMSFFNFFSFSLLSTIFFSYDSSVFNSCCTTLEALYTRQFNSQKPMLSLFSSIISARTSLTSDSSAWGIFLPSLLAFSLLADLQFLRLLHSLGDWEGSFIPSTCLHVYHPVTPSFLLCIILLICLGQRL